MNILQNNVGIKKYLLQHSETNVNFNNKKQASKNKRTKVDL